VRYETAIFVDTAFTCPRTYKHYPGIIYFVMSV